MKIKLELQEVKKGNIHRIISKRYDSEGNLIDEQSVGYIESRLADLINFDDRKF